MSSHYLLDGYNILYALATIPPGSWEAKRLALSQKLTTEKPYGNNQVTLVFDSREGSGDRSSAEAMDIVFTAGETADDWISQFVRRAANPRILIVVTDDQGLRRLIRGTGAKSIGTKEFWLKGKKTVVQPAPPPDIDTDSITNEFKKKWL